MRNECIWHVVSLISLGVLLYFEFFYTIGVQLHSVLQYYIRVFFAILLAYSMVIEGYILYLAVRV